MKKPLQPNFVRMLSECNVAELKDGDLTLPEGFILVREVCELPVDLALMKVFIGKLKKCREEFPQELPTEMFELSLVLLLTSPDPISDLIDAQEKVYNILLLDFIKTLNLPRGKSVSTFFVRNGMICIVDEVDSPPANPADDLSFEQ
ncbi:MAG: hypothetical protein V4576_01580 [Patescibacteria group bacterium]